MVVFFFALMDHTLLQSRWNVPHNTHILPLSSTDCEHNMPTQINLQSSVTSYFSIIALQLLHVSCFISIINHCTSSMSLFESLSSVSCFWIHIHMQCPLVFRLSYLQLHLVSWIPWTRFIIMLFFARTRAGKKPSKTEKA